MSAHSPARIQRPDVLATSGGCHVSKPFGVDAGVRTDVPHPKRLMCHQPPSLGFIPSIETLAPWKTRLSCLSSLAFKQPQQGPQAKGPAARTASGWTTAPVPGTSNNSAPQFLLCFFGSRPGEAWCQFWMPSRRLKSRDCSAMAWSGSAFDREPSSVGGNCFDLCDT